MRGAALALAPLLLAVLGALASPAAAQTNPELSIDAASPPEPIAPGGQGNASLTVKLCQQGGTVSLEGRNAPSWMRATFDPSSFHLDVPPSGCAQREVAVRLAVGRDAPAFDPKFLTVHGSAQAAAGSDTADEQLAVQAGYGAEVRANPPAAITVTRGDSGSLQLTVSVGANGGTVLEVTASDPARQLTIQSLQTSTGAGAGLDDVKTETYRITVSVSPGAKVGANALPLHLATKYSRSSGYAGQSLDVQATVNVKDASAPGPELPLVATSLAVLALLGRRRRGG
jgi:hypothetical protein